MLKFSEVQDNIFELTLMMLCQNEFHAFVRQTPELVSSHCVVRTKLAQIRYEAQEGPYTFDGCWRLYCGQFLNSLGVGSDARWVKS